MAEPQDINLFAEVAQEQAKSGVFRRKINMAAIAALLLTAAAIAALFGYWLFLVSASTRIASQTKDAESEITSRANTDKEITRRALVAKLSDARNFLAGVARFSIGFDKLIATFKDSGASLKDATLKNDGKVTITGEAGSSDAFGKMVDKLTSEELSATFGQVKLTALTFEGAKNSYTFAIDMKFLKKGFPEETKSGGLKKP